MCKNLDHKARAELVDRVGSVLVIKSEALTQVFGQGNKNETTAVSPHVGVNDDRNQRGRAPGSTRVHQSNRLLRREKERMTRARVREQRLVAHLLASQVNPSLDGTDLGTTATTKCLQRWQSKGEDCVGIGEKRQTDQSLQDEPHRQWVTVSSDRTDSDQDRTMDDGILLIVSVQICGREFRALIDSGATRNFVSPDCVLQANLECKDQDTFLELGDASNVLSRGCVTDVPIITAGFSCKIDLIVTNLLHDVDIVLGMTWLTLVNPIIDWRNASLSIPYALTSAFLRGAWLDAAIKTGTIRVLSSHQQLFP